MDERLLRVRAQVGELAGALRASREEVGAQVAAATAKDRENSQLWEQVRAHGDTPLTPCSRTRNVHQARHGAPSRMLQILLA